MPAITVDATTFALFGALGDLALRKLFPALYQLDRAGLLNNDTRILALSRDPGEPAAHLERIDQALRRYVPAAQLDESVLSRFQGRLGYLTMDFRNAKDYAALAEMVAPEMPLIAYFATPAAVYGSICENLAAPDWPSRRESFWRSRSGTISTRRDWSTMPLRSTSPRRASIGSTTIAARKRSRT
jgi:glucose-6-phosphate 1-dehydrogenase